MEVALLFIVSLVFVIKINCDLLIFTLILEKKNERVAMLCGVYNNVLYSYLIDFAGWMVEMR